MIFDPYVANTINSKLEFLDFLVKINAVSHSTAAKAWLAIANSGLETSAFLDAFILEFYSDFGD